ncbi:MAG: class I poly(R)-hydroxyalkanoic acid synthase [Magnetospirillum sp. WYHS-4]
MTDLPDSDKAAKAWAELSARAAKAAEMFWKNQASGDGFAVPDPGMVMRSFAEAASKLMADPERLAAAQARLWQDHARLWEATSKRLKGEAAAPVAMPDPSDKRFADEAWSEQAVFDFVKQSYLLTSRWMQGTVQGIEGLDGRTARKVDFYTRQWLDALAPSNFIATNPKVLKATLESGGENLLKGFRHLVEDMEKGQGRLQISMTDAKAFVLGENVAATPGKVVFQNDLMQLIQYAPSTPKARRRPLLIVPPWINKFYVLDLQPRNSFIKWAVDQGNTVFVVSWVNPDERLAHKTFDDYLLEGPVAALDEIRRMTGEAKANLVGYCIGGTLTACTLAWLAARKEDRVASATFLTTMTDFREAGELSVFIDEEQIGLLERHMQKKGYLEGAHMATVFNLMRDNDLIWSFVVNNYLLGRDPLPFDLLYWNADSTRMPAMMHGFYLREMYLNNRLIEPGGIALAGQAIDLRRIKVPVYLLSTREDHIAPWKSTYAATQIYKGPVKFVLAASGHIAGVVNPPAKGRYCYWTGDALPADPQAWQAAAERHEGSWWPDWDAWLKKHAGRGQVAARDPGEGLEDAPGSYVKLRIVE